MFTLAWRLHRAELVALVVAAVGLSVGSILIAARLDGLVAGCRGLSELVAPCGGPAEVGTIYDTETNGQMWLIIVGLAVLPFAAGVVIGAPMLARELEHGTALVSWPLARSRARWLAVRLLPLALLAVAILLVPAMAGEIIIRAHYSSIDPGTNFEGYGMRGPLVAIRFVVVLLLAAIVGLWTRRQLPALLVAAIVAAGLGVGLMQVQRLWLAPIEQTEAFFERPIDHLGSMYVETRYRDKDGAWIPNEQAWALMSWDGEGEEPDWSQLPQEVMFVVPRDRYHDVVAREGLALTAAAAGLAALLLVIAKRRRPG